jgi:putative copper export protein/methionine-rich copper-binding protein CopC
MLGRRIWVLAGAGLALVVATPGPAEAHALLASSDPAEGVRLNEAPNQIVLRFTEAPELALSEVSVLDRSGAGVGTGNPRPVPGDTSALSVTVPGLDQDVYTVTWRTVSRVDGHPSAGTFAFGVGVSPVGAPPAVAAVETPDPSPLEMAGRLILFLGLGLLVGAAWVGALAFAELPLPVRRLAGWAWVVALVGLIALAVAQQRGSGVGFAEFLPTTPGRALLYRAGAIALAGTALLAASLWPSSRRLALLLAGLAAAGAMLAHVAAGHAAARGDLAWAKVVGQWVHFLAVGVWIGGLAALLLGIGGKPSAAKASAVRRFSAVAAFALAAVAVTGLVRAVNEVGSWSALFTTGYGLLVVAKVVLIGGLAGLGAINRYRNVPRAGTSLGGLRRVSRGELALAGGALAAAAILATLVPPAQVPAEARPAAALTATGFDFATSVRARLEVNPALPGPNRFDLRVTDYDTGAAVAAQRVSLGFSYLGGAELAESRLDLKPIGDGRYRATGSNLSIGGPWEATALIQRGADSVEVPLRLATLCQAVEVPGQGNEPTIHLVEVPGAGSVEGYLIPLGQGRTEVHFTFIDEQGRPLDVQGEPSMLASQEGQDPQTLAAEFLSRGHYFAVARLAAGPWRFDGAATGPETSLAGCFEQTLEG